MNEYQEQLLDHYKNPRNFGKPDWQADAQNKQINISCGDEIEFFLKISRDLRIEDVSFIGRGCSISIASASLLSEEIKNKELSYVKNLTEHSILKLIGIPLTIQRSTCATLPLYSIQNALNTLS
jgi:nitrogen fixation NifU-like protein